MAKKQPSKEEIKRKNRRGRRVAIGAIISLLVVIGVVAIITSSIGLVKTLTDDSDERKDFEDRIRTLVSIEILPFDAVANADQNTILEACIWGVIMTEDLSTFEKDTVTGAYIIPSVDVDRYAAKLFGPDYTLQHGTFSAPKDQLEFIFNQDQQAYVLPVTGLTDGYVPVIDEIINGRGTKKLVVGYIPPTTGFVNNNTVLTPSKYYNYIFTKNGDNYYLSSIEESDKVAPVATATPAPNQLEQLDPNTQVEDIVNQAVEDIDIQDATQKADNSATDSSSDDTQE